MKKILDIGKRIDLVPLDLYFENISIALYSQKDEQGSFYLVHTYSQIPGVGKRINTVINAMKNLGGMEQDNMGRLRFPCKNAHNLAVKRVFLEACKVDPTEKVTKRPLTTLDKKSGLQINLLRSGNGEYQVTAIGESREKERRISFIAGGLMKLGELDEVIGSLDRIFFPCSSNHDEMIGLLLLRAPNVRAILRDQATVAGRGVLAAPSQQDL